MKLPKKSQPMIWSVIGACLVLYFLYHTVQGDHGWLSAIRLRHEVKSAEETLTKLREEREAAEHRLKLLRKDSLDPDMLDEEVRRQLNYAKPNEIIILTGSKDNNAPQR